MKKTTEIGQITSSEMMIRRVLWNGFLIIFVIYRIIYSPKNGLIDQNVNITDKIIPNDVVELCRMFYSNITSRYDAVGFMHPKCFIESSPLNTSIYG